MRCIVAGWLVVAGSLVAGEESIWIEGEQPSESSVVKHPWYDGEVKRDLLSGGGFISNFASGQVGSASYEFEAEDGGEFVLWVRANPVQTRLAYRLNDGEAREIDMSRRQTGNTNLAADGKPDLRFVAWAEAGKVKLKKGGNRITFRFESESDHHGSLDCFVFAPGSFAPMGILKPGEVAAHQEKLARDNEGWLPWVPGKDEFADSAIDLRFLNEKFAGESGGIATRGSDFVFRTSGEKVRFWGVNGPPDKLRGEELAECARMLAKRGVNLVRIHGAVFDGKTGELERDRMAHLHEVVAAMKKEGIYSHISCYFPLWMTPEPGPGWREGYDGVKHPFALLYFEPEFQALHRSWLEAVLTTPGPAGLRLIDEPALMGMELVNEDSFFFWTFDEKNVPAPQMRKLEAMFADWAAGKHGSVAKALAAWAGPGHPKDGDGRLGIRPLYQIFNDRTARDQDTAAFLMETQRGFYEGSVKWLLELGFDGLITASNWTTAHNGILGPLEKYSYAVGDFIDRHGYFGCNHQGDNAGWSIREGHTYGDRSALRFDPEVPGEPKEFSHPAADPEFNGMPSMISETTWNRPNRYRGEAPLFYAVYGALQGGDAVIHFALDSMDWSVKPGFFMQPWTLMAPTQAGQFPAAALIYRKGLIREGEVLADLELSVEDATALKGSPLVARANLDELRKADTPGRATDAATGIDPLIHFAGRSKLQIGGGSGRGKLADLDEFVDRENRTVTSTTGELKLDYGKGLLWLSAPAAQGAMGDLNSGGTLDLPELEIRSSMEPGQIVAVALDGEDLSGSGRILLQVMSEEKPSGFTTEPAGEGVKRITNLGVEPWLIRKMSGTVRFKRADAADLKVTALDINGRAVAAAGTADEIELRPETVYYLIEKE